MYQISDIEILIATMNRTDFDFLKAIFMFTDYSQFKILIVNQTTENAILTSDNEHIKVINSFAYGLSNSRNIALKNASNELIIFTDDDVVFQPNFTTKFLEAFNTHIAHHGFRFQFLNGKGSLAKKYPKVFEDKLSNLQILNTSSVELGFKRESIQNSKLHFDTDFGLGAKFPMGEEAIFVADAIKNGLKIGFFPEVLLAHYSPSTIDKSNISDIYYIQSAVFYRIFSKMYLFWIALKLFFDIKQSKINFSEISYLINQAKKGKQAYVNTTKLPTTKYPKN